MKNRRRYLIKYFLIFCISVASILVLILATGCRQIEPQIETFNVVRGDIEESISSTGTVDSAEKRNYSVLQSAEVVQALKTGDTFKKDQVLIEVDNSKTEIYLAQAEKNLELAEQAISLAKINYQSALDANHVAIQLAESSNALAEQTTQGAYKALEDSNILADASIRAAYTAIEDANNYLKGVKSSPLSSNALIAQAEGGINSAEGAYEQAKESARSQSDGAENAFEQSQYNQSITYWNNVNSLEVAQANIQIMQKNIQQVGIQYEISNLNFELAKLDIDNNKIDAPFDGIVVLSNFSEGENATPGVVALSVISYDFEIKSDINETDISRIKTGQEVELNFDAYPDMTFTGEISAISPVSKNIAGIITYEITVMPDADTKEYLRSGLSANLDIKILQTKDVLYVPVQSVYEEDGKEYVDVLIEDNQVKKVQVTTGNSNYDYIEIRSGLSEGDAVVLSAIDQAGLTEDTGGGFFNFGG